MYEHKSFAFVITASSLVFVAIFILASAQTDLAYNLILYYIFLLVNNLKHFCLKYLNMIFLILK